MTETVTEETMIYIAGPMSGIIDHNRHEFVSAEKMWLARGIPKDCIFNPIDHEYSKRVQAGEITGTEAYRLCMKIDCDWICQHATMLYMLQGWERSYGARAEHALATALNLEIVYQ